MFQIIGDPFVYWILKTLLLLCLFICGYFISFRDKTGSNYWKYAAPALIFYSLEYGLRWNRSFDYPHYYQDLTGRLYTDYTDPVYLFWIDLFKSTGLSPHIAFVFYSAILIFSFLLILKKYRKIAFLALPLFMILPTQADNHIRQFFALAFILIGYYFHDKEKIKYSIVFYLLGIGIHFVGVFCVIFIVFVKYFKIEKIIKSPWILVIAYLIFYSVWDTSYLDGFAKTLSRFNLGDDISMQSYINNADYWFTDESDINNKLGIKSEASNLYYIILQLIIGCGILYYGFICAKNRAEYRVPFWAMTFCIFNNVFGGNNEIFSRFNSWLICFVPFIISYIVMEQPLSKKIKYIVVFLFIYNYLYVSFISKMFSINLTGYAYIWDK